MCNNKATCAISCHHYNLLSRLRLEWQTKWGSNLPRHQETHQPSPFHPAPTTTSIQCLRMFVHDQNQSTKLFPRIPKPSCFEDRDHHDKFLLHEWFLRIVRSVATWWSENVERSILCRSGIYSIRIALGGSLSFKNGLKSQLEQLQQGEISVTLAERPKEFVGAGGDHVESVWASHLWKVSIYM